MSNENLSEWVDETGAQGDPLKYCKTDLEIWVKKLFEHFNFKAGKSNKERRRAFEAVWDASDGNGEAIAYGFNAALKARVHSLAYVKACIKGFGAPVSVPKPTAPVIPNTPKVKPDPPKIPATRRKKAADQQPQEDVKWS